MNLTMARKALLDRVTAYVATLPPYPMTDGGERVPLVFAQEPPSDNDGVEHIPCLIARVEGWRQQGDTRRAKVAVGVMLCHADQAQLFADVEGVLDGLAADLIAYPWLDQGAYQLAGEPWNVVIGESAGTLLNGMLEFDIVLPALQEMTTPNGTPLAEVI